MKERDAAERLGISVRTLQKRRLQGDGSRFVKLGRSVRYAGEDLEAYIESKRRSSISESLPNPKGPRAGSLRFPIGV